MSPESQVSKSYNGPEVERKWSRYWLENRFFEADPSSEDPPYSMVIPPPNVTGVLHMGHALNITIQDILVRWQRMKGRNVLWLPGTDHAGIATQNVVERHLASDGRRREELGREKFEELVWEWKEEYEPRILGQIQRLGGSCDWSRTRFTMDEGLSQAVREVFVQLYEEELIYRGEYLVNWCPRCSTAISDLEVIHRPASGKLWHIRYPLSSGDGFLEVATTRPETMLGDTAVAVHPEDGRYQELIGKTVILPLMEREIPLIADLFVDRDFGTGAVKVTPGHDPSDFEAGRRHQLPILSVIGEDGTMTKQAGPYAGLDRFEARRRVVEDLREKGLLTRVKDHDHQVGHCQRCDTIVEPLVSTQWFVKVQSLAGPAVEAVEKSDTQFVPRRFEKVFLNWMENIHDWCVSRQLWWGHRIPAWYCLECETVMVAREAPSCCDHCESSRLRQEEDVLDTWFSSGLWPFSTMGWPKETLEQEVYYPTTTLVTGPDIIFFWVARMMMLGLRFKDTVPFRQVHITGLVRDEKGRKMSKSRGNVIDPLEIIEAYGADAVRFTLSITAAPGTDIPFSISRMAGYRAFCNKIWNAGRFLLLKLERTRPVSTAEISDLLERNSVQLEDRWIVSRLHQVIGGVETNLGKFRFHAASDELYHFFWDEFCDWYIEFIKVRLGSDNARDREIVNTTALYVVEASLRLLHPFMPFVTEELWQRLPHEGPTIALAAYPIAERTWIDAQAVERIERLQGLISSIRTVRTENKVDPRHRLPCRLKAGTDSRQLVEDHGQKVVTLARLQQITLMDELPGGGVQIRGLSSLGEFALQLDEVIDVAAERDRLERHIEKLNGEIESLEGRLQNPSFIEKAPAQVVEGTREKFADARNRLARLQEQLNGLPQS